MCVIIHKPANKDFDEKDLRTAFENNPDGFGFMYYDETLNKIIAKKSINITEDQIVKIVNRFKDRDVCYHYRYKTHGLINNAQCHPFKVLDKQKHGVDMYFMHNGTINTVTPNKDESDTQAFNRQILKPLLSKKPSLIKSPAFQTMLLHMIGKGSKLCFMFGKGEVIKINAEAGAERHGCWVSNEYSFRDGHRLPKTGGTVGNFYNGYSYPSAATNRNNVVSVDPTKEVKFFDSPLKVGDKVWIFSKDKPDFFTEGVVEDIRSSQFEARLTNDFKVTTRVSFWLVDGQSYGMHSNMYFAVPAVEYDKDTPSETVKNKKAKIVVDPVSQNNSNGGITTTVIKGGNTPVEKKDQSKTSCSTPFQESTEDNPENILDFDGIDRYGGAWIPPVTLTDYGGFSFEDIYEMDVQERYDFFNENQDVCFNMWQDLVENIVIQDEEFYDEIAFHSEAVH